MHDLVKELHDILEEQAVCYQQLLELAEAKQPVLVNNKIEELDNIVKREETIIFQVGRLEERRNAVHQELANHFALSADSLTAAELEKRLDGEIALKLRNSFEKLARTLKKLEQINKTNTELIKHALEYINFSLGMLTGIEDTPSYDEKEDKNKGAVSRIFDQKI